MLTPLFFSSGLPLALETFNKEDIFSYSSFWSNIFLYLPPDSKNCEQKSHSSLSSRMAGTPMAYNSSRVKSINLKWYYFCSARPSSSNLLHAWQRMATHVSSIAPLAISAIKYLIKSPTLFNLPLDVKIKRSYFCVILVILKKSFF